MNISRAEKANARWWLGSASTMPMPRQIEGRSLTSRWWLSLGKVSAAPSASTPLSRAMPMKGACQLQWLARNSPRGTPATVDTEKDDITMPMARPRRSKGTTSATMVCDSAESTPPNMPAATRATIRKP